MPAGEYPINLHAIELTVSKLFNIGKDIDFFDRLLAQNSAPSPVLMAVF